MTSQFFCLFFTDESYSDSLVQLEVAENLNNTTATKLPVVLESVAEERATIYEASHPPTAKSNTSSFDDPQIEVDEAIQLVNIEARILRTEVEELLEEQPKAAVDEDEEDETPIIPYSFFLVLHKCQFSLFS